MAGSPPELRRDRGEQERTGWEAEACCSPGGLDFSLQARREHFELEDENNTGSKDVVPRTMPGAEGRRGERRPSTGVRGVNLAQFCKGSEEASGNTGNTRKWTVYVQHLAGASYLLGGLQSLS